MKYLGLLVFALGMNSYFLASADELKLGYALPNDHWVYFSARLHPIPNYSNLTYLSDPFRLDRFPEH
jgi:hypothetical protein